MALPVFLTGLVLLWLPSLALRRGWRWAFPVSLSVAALAWLPLLAQTVARAGFILRHGGMDCAGCEGSPMAFLMNMVFEQWFFLPLSAVLLAGVAHLRQARRMRP